MNLFQEAKNQLKPISIQEIKDILKKNYPTEFSKMIIDNNAVVKRVDFYHSLLNYTKSDRKYYLIKFPLYDSIKDDFRLFEGGVPKFGEKAIVDNESYLVEFGKQKGATISDTLDFEIIGIFNFPFDVLDNEINPVQRKYFIAKHTYQETCTKCKGQKYITCTSAECNGKHVWRCKKCIGKGEITCSDCKGHGYNKCSRCSGKGQKITKECKDGKQYIKKEKCSKCRGKGENPCLKCGTSGKIRCKTCAGDGEITCSHCYSDRERLGTIDCPKCLTTGKISQILCVETDIESLQSNQLINTGDEIEINEEIIKNHINEELNINILYKNINGQIIDASDEISNKLLPKYEKDLRISKDNHPLLLRADILYQIIPCLELSYKHILTNEIHTINIVDIWNNPELINKTDAEKTKTNVKSVSKSVSNIFSKVFKTKGHKFKEDRRIEIKLMIYLVKSDGKIEEEEKIFLSNQILNLNDFTNSEKNDFFHLINADSLPELTKEDVTFNDINKGKEIISTLEKMALVDGEFDTSEKELIEKLKKIVT